MCVWLCVCVCIERGQRETKPFSLCVGVICGFKVLCFHLLTTAPLKRTVSLPVGAFAFVDVLLVNMMCELTITSADWMANPRSQRCLSCQKQTATRACPNANLHTRSGVFKPRVVSDGERELCVLTPRKNLQTVHQNIRDHAYNTLKV